jgi:hypothetical protein
MDYPKLKPEQDKRRKIPESEHEYIRKRYKEHGESQRALARSYGVSRRLITFILEPLRVAIQKKRVQDEKRWLKYYDKNKHREYMRTHRVNKKQAGQMQAVNAYEQAKKQSGQWSHGREGLCTTCNNGRYYKYLADHERRSHNK